MKKFLTVLVVLGSVYGLSLFAGEMKKEASAAPQWSVNMTVIESCSCPMFCQCYFHTEPSAHHEESGKHFCQFNMAWNVNSGKHGSVDLTGSKFWIAGDLGADWSQGQTDWAVVTFDKSTTKEQRDAIAVIAGHLFPVKWKSFSAAEGNIDKWEFSVDKAHATLDGGKSAEVKLMRRAASATGPGPIVVKNLMYWTAPRNEGFVLMGPNEVNAYRVGPNAFETKGTNGFMITVDLNSKDYAKPVAGGM